jgi:N-acetylmuramoyl-L-alanine amidase
MRTVVIDPGHGGEDAGARGPGGAVEKDVTLQIAQRLRATIESRLGLRVMLTRDGDQAVPMDRRTALANHNTADLFISLHANASHRPEARGAQVWTLGADAYRDQMTQASAQRRAVPVLGGGTRLIEPVPWDLAQMPFVERSSALGTRLARLLSDHGVPLFNRPVLQAPVRPLVGANMPAVLLELGFLTNADDERALTSAPSQGVIVDAVLALVAETRQQVASGVRPGGGR